MIPLLALLGSGKSKTNKMLDEKLDPLKKQLDETLGPNKSTGMNKSTEPDYAQMLQDYLSKSFAKPSQAGLIPSQFSAPIQPSVPNYSNTFSLLR